MSTTTLDLRRYNDLLRDLRHMEARAASDLADWLVHLELEGKADRTLYEYVRKLAPLLREFPDKQLEEFTSTDISLVLTRTPKRSRHIVRSIINRFFIWAETQDRIDKNPMRKVPQVKHPERRHRTIFTLTDVALLEALPAPDGHLFAILFGTGLRKAEARRLTRGDIDLDRRRLIVRQGKGGKDRVVALTPSAIQAVADLDLLEQLGRDDHFWYSHPGGGQLMSRRWPIGDTTYSRWYTRCLERARVEYLSPHTTRHTYHDLLRRYGLGLEERRVLMGHASIRTTVDQYGHLSMDEVSEQLAGFRLEELDVPRADRPFREPQPRTPRQPKPSVPREPKPRTPRQRPDKPDVLSATAVERMFARESDERTSPRVAPEHTASMPKLTDQDEWLT